MTIRARHARCGSREATSADPIPRLKVRAFKTLEKRLAVPRTGRNRTERSRLGNLRF